MLDSGEKGEQMLSREDWQAAFYKLLEDENINIVQCLDSMPEVQVTDIEDVIELNEHSLVLCHFKVAQKTICDIGAYAGVVGLHRPSLDSALGLV